jgi:hypothetical protein
VRLEAPSGTTGRRAHPSGVGRVHVGEGVGRAVGRRDGDAVTVTVLVEPGAGLTTYTVGPGTRVGAGTSTGPGGAR